MGIVKYCLKRIIALLGVLLVISLVVFLMAYLAPGDPVVNFLGMQPGRDFSADEVNRIRHLWGLDLPLYQQFMNWLWRLLHGDLGRSYILRREVTEIIGSKIFETLKLTVLSLGVAFSVAIPIGVISATKQNSKTDNAFMGAALFFWSMPAWWLGLILLFIFSINLGWLPAHGAYTILPGGQTLGFWDSLSDGAEHALLPVLTLAATYGLGFTARLVRGSMLEVLRQDYLKTARAKGLRERVVIYRHALRNAMLPVTTLIGLYMGTTIGGSAIVETTFGWPGLGRQIVDSSFLRDYPVIMGTTLVVAAVIMVSILITDIAYGYLDPRIRYD